VRGWLGLKQSHNNTQKNKNNLEVTEMAAKIMSDYLKRK